MPSALFLADSTCIIGHYPSFSQSNLIGGGIVLTSESVNRSFHVNPAMLRYFTLLSSRIDHELLILDLNERQSALTMDFIHFMN